MAIATITATGTWSTLSDVDALGAPALPRQHARGGVDQRFHPNSLNYKAAVDTGLLTNGYPEVNQFLGHMAAGYGITAGAALVRLRDILESMQSGESPELLRTYP